MVADSRVGTVIEDKYRLDEQIGQGSMGAVFRGTQLMVDRSVAIKLLHPNFAGHEKIQARFEVEAKAIARLNHPNCITLFDFGYADDMEAFYTVVEFIDGKPLDALIDERPSEARVVDLMKQIASALGHAHHHGILHRDLKPENIMLAAMTDGSEMVKVLDFGIAQIMQGNTDDEFESDRLTRVGEVFGTPPYMSPEQAQSARDLTPATDLYSLGIIFYELLTGRLPFFGESPVEIMTKHMEESPPPIDDPNISTAVETVVMQMLAKDPEERPEGGDRIVAMLDAIPEDELSTSSRSAARVEGDAGHGETLMESPPDQTGPHSTRITVDDPSLNDTDHDDDPDDDPADKSAILELTDLATDPSPGSSTETDPPQQDSLPDNAPEPRRASRSPEEAAPTQSREALTATQMVDPGEEEALEEETSRLAWTQRRSTALLIIVSLGVLGLLAWVLVEYQPFSMTGEESMSRAGELADYQPQASAPPPSEPTDDLDAESDDPSDDGFEPRQVSIGDETPPNSDDAGDEDDPDDEDPEDEDAESDDQASDDPSSSEPAEEPPSIDEPAPRPRPQPQPEPDPEPSDSDDPPPGPPRLDL